MKKTPFFLTLLFAFTINHTFSQTNWCGLTTEDAEHIRERIARYRQNYIQLVPNPLREDGNNRMSTTYLPVRFFLVADSDGNDRVPVAKALDALCRLNVEYEPHDIQFFIKELKYPNNNDVHNAPAGANGTSAIRERMEYDAINVFLVDDISAGIAAFYQPPAGPGGNDWIVSASAYADDEKTLPHEMGHFLDLLHPHTGWECQPYNENIHGNPVTVTENCGVEIEFVNGSNCETAGDMLCDTPADYGIFDSSNDCSFDLQIFDFNNDLLAPMLENIMAYYGGCNDYVFTADQAALMKNSLTTPERAYIPQNTTPNTDEVNGLPTPLSPVNLEEVETYNHVPFEWTPVSGASFYLLEITSPGGNPLSFVTGNTSITVFGLLPSETYFWKIRAFNEYSTCGGFSSQRILKTGDVFVDADEAQLDNSWVVYPNLISSNNTFKVEWPKVTLSDATLQLQSLTGQVLVERQWEGSSTIEWPTDGLSAGLYLLVLETAEGRSTKRVLVK